MMWLSTTLKQSHETNSWIDSFGYFWHRKLFKQKLEEEIIERGAPFSYTEVLRPTQIMRLQININLAFREYPTRLTQVWFRGHAIGTLYGETAARVKLTELICILAGPSNPPPPVAYATLCPISAMNDGLCIMLSDGSNCASAVSMNR